MGSQDAAFEARGYLQRNCTHRAFVEMSLDLNNQFFWLIPFDDKSLIKPWQFGRFKDYSTTAPRTPMTLPAGFLDSVIAAGHCDCAQVIR